MSEWIDIGEQLRLARESKGLELRDVEHKTRIPLATLSALEESDYSVFSSPTYARSFLSQYSEYLEVDAHEWIDAFETGDVLSNLNDHGYLQQHKDHLGDHQMEDTPRRSHSSTSRKESSGGDKFSGGKSILQTLTVFLVTALLIGGGIYAYKEFEPMLSGETHSTDDAENDSDEGSNNGDTEKTPEPDKNLVTAPPKAVPAEPDTKKPEIAQAETTPEKKNPPVKPADPIITQPKPRTGPPPKALVIEEDE